MKPLFRPFFTWCALMLASTPGCQKLSKGELDNTPIPRPSFYRGADVSYVNQILDHGGHYTEGGTEKKPYSIFQSHGYNLARIRLWHNPGWTKDLYGADGVQLYNDLLDVERAIREAKGAGMQVLLDLHYSDTWADPGKQTIPKAWMGIRDLQVLADSVYAYTYHTLRYLGEKGLMPELVQTGNEINCGMLFTEAPTGFPTAHACGGEWAALGTLLNKALQAVHDASAQTDIKPLTLLHVADPKNVDWWFDNVIHNGKVVNFDMIGFSYYPIWHTTVPVDKLSDQVAAFKKKYRREVMILETAYPWTGEGFDGYNNIFGPDKELKGFPFTPVGHLKMMTAIAQQLKKGGGCGVVYWEPAWITSSMKDLWGQGSAWENCALFDRNGEVLSSMDFMKD